MKGFQSILLMVLLTGIFSVIAIASYFTVFAYEEASKEPDILQKLANFAFTIFYFPLGHVLPPSSILFSLALDSLIYAIIITLLLALAKGTK